MVMKRMEGESMRLATKIRQPLDGRIVGDQRDNTGIRDPSEQRVIPAIESCAGLGKTRGIRRFAHAQQHAIKTGPHADHVALLNFDPVCFLDPHQLILSDQHSAFAEMGSKVDHDAPPLYAALGHMLNSKRART